MRAWRKLGLVSATAAACSAPTFARADGNQELGQSMVIHAPGGGVAYAGAGFAARPNAPPVGERTLSIIDVPEGTLPVRALLYWVQLGGGDDQVLFNGEVVAGTLIGQSANTCWPSQYDAGNFVYRADVTDLVRFDYAIPGDPSDDEGDNTLSGLTSSQGGDVDAQGAELVFVYGDPTPGLEETFRLVVNDGAFTQNIDTTGGFTGSLEFELPITTVVPPNFTNAEFTILGGDGQNDPIDFLGLLLNSSEGRPQFQGENLASGRDHFDGDEGRYWDDETFDVQDLLVGGETSLTWGMDTCRGSLLGLFNECGVAQALDPGDGDCIVYPATFLALTFPDVDQDDVEDSEDNCVLDDNPDQTDTDDDGLGDVCDDDDDDDGSPDDEEDDEGTDPLDPDTDGDGVEDGPDNCPLDDDPDQTDTDGDGIGDVCDDDGAGGGGQGGSGQGGSGQGGSGQGGSGQGGSGQGGSGQGGSGQGGDGAGANGQGGDGAGANGQGGDGTGANGQGAGDASTGSLSTGSSTDAGTTGTSSLSGSSTESAASGGDDLDGLVASGGACTAAPGEPSGEWWRVAIGAAALALVRRRRP